jgi:hypothetical protein
VIFLPKAVDVITATWSSPDNSSFRGGGRDHFDLTMASQCFKDRVSRGRAAYLRQVSAVLSGCHAGLIPGQALCRWKQERPAHRTASCGSLPGLE